MAMCTLYMFSSLKKGFFFVQLNSNKKYMLLSPDLYITFLHKSIKVRQEGQKTNQKT